MEVYEEVLTAIQELEVEFKNTQIVAQNIGQCLPKLHALRATAAEPCPHPNINEKDNKEYTA